MRIQPARRGRETRRPRVTTRVGSVLAAAVLSISGTLAFPAASDAASGPRFLGPLLSHAETSNITWARDGGISVPLPNGTDFWIFGDSPKYQWSKGAWRLKTFIQGSTAAQRRFTPGKMLDGPLTEIRAGQPLKASNQPKQFLSKPKVYLPDGSGRACTKANGGHNAEAVRWITGAALMPDKKNIVIPFVEACVLDAFTYGAEGWGFALFNYKTRTFSMKPHDVFRPTPDGASIASTQFFGSPIIRNRKVTFYSWACCSGSGVYTTTMNATVAALENPASYAPQATSGPPPTFNVSVSPPSKKHAKITMYVLEGEQGEYAIYAASAPTGPWAQVASGQLPRCAQAPIPCRSFALHPELSPAKRLVVSYYNFGYGPGIATKHPSTSTQLAHTVLASVPCTC